MQARIAAISPPINRRRPDDAMINGLRVMIATPVPARPHATISSGQVVRIGYTCAPFGAGEAEHCRKKPDRDPRRETPQQQRRCKLELAIEPGASDTRAERAALGARRRSGGQPGKVIPAVHALASPEAEA